MIKVPATTTERLGISSYMHKTELSNSNSNSMTNKILDQMKEFKLNHRSIKVFDKYELKVFIIIYNNLIWLVASRGCTFYLKTPKLPLKYEGRMQVSIGGSDLVSEIYSKITSIKF